MLTGSPPPFGPALTESESCRISPEGGRAPALDGLCHAFGLSPFERAVILLCAGIELDSAIAQLCAAAQGDPMWSYPTFSLALAALPGAHLDALSPGRPLRHWRLIEVGAGSTLTVSPLRIDERVLHHLVGVSYLDERLAAMVELLGWDLADGLAPSQTAVVDRVVAAWAVPHEQRVTPVIQLCGSDPADCRAVAAAAAAAIGLRVAVLPADLVPSSAVELDALVRLWERESALGGTVLMVECDGLDPGADPVRVRSVSRLIERIDSAVIVSDRERRRVSRRPAIGFDVHHPTRAEQRSAWWAARARRRTPTVWGWTPLPRSLTWACPRFDPPPPSRSPAGPLTRHPASLAPPGTSATRSPARGWRTWPSGSSPAPAGTTWSCPLPRPSRCAGSPCTSATGPPSTTPGVSPPSHRGGWASAPVRRRERHW